MTPAAIALPVLFAAFVWWFSTGAILWLDRLPRRTFAWSFAAMSALSCAALYYLVAGAADASVTGAYVGFAGAVAIWGWHEMSFLMGYIVGPRREACPDDAHGIRRFKLAAATLIHHEIAIAVTGLVLVAITWGQPNQIGVLTFLVLWAMRLSAKFNLFLGAPYRAEEMLPAHLAHLKSYFRHRRMNALLPVSLAGGAALIWLLANLAFAPGANAFEQAGYLLLLAITALAVMEHIFMFVPPPNAMLWGWAAPQAANGAAAPAPASSSHASRLSATTSLD